MVTLILQTQISRITPIKIPITCFIFNYALVYILLSLLSPNNLQAQNFTFTFENTIPLYVNQHTLSNPWAGGLNAGQYSSIHLNNDTVEDLVIFDRTTNKLSTFIAVPQDNSFRYQYAPQYETHFPADLQAWMLLVDFNRDGKKDIFTHTNLGIKVYQNLTTTDQKAWKLIADPVETKGFSSLINLLVQINDIPAILDVDKDGDIDILTFDNIGGSVEYHKNLSMENFGHADSLKFERITSCWGKFNQGADCNEFVLNVDCGDNNGRSGQTLRVKHTGSSLLILDTDGDGDNDVITGHVHCNNLAMLANGNTLSETIFTQVQAHFPMNNPVNFSMFPAAYYEDVDFDGKKDLIVTPNVSLNEGNLVDFVHSNWFYKNTGTNEFPQFVFQQSDLLQSGMLDAGENAFPALGDYDGDGDMDLFIGNRGVRVNNEFYSTLSLYKNIGTKEKAAFQLETQDYLGLSSLRLTNIKPFFTDCNNDRVPDLLFANTYDGGRKTDLKFILNTAPRGGAFQFSVNAIKTLPLVFSANDNPVLYDLDSDGILDALVGKFDGNIEHYKNTGTNVSPTYILQSNKVGELPFETSDRNVSLAISDLNRDGKADLISGDRKGKLKIYTDVLAQLNNIFIADTSMVWNASSEKYMAPKLSGLIFPAVGDINADGMPELIVGTQAGGIMILRNTLENNNPNPNPEETGPIYPNPADTYVYINLPADGEVSVFSILGQPLITDLPVKANKNTPIDINNLPNGVYIFKFSSPEISMIKKIVVSK